MNLKKLIKETLIKEAAGISFEVRQWAQILSNEISERVKKADELEKEKQGYEEPKEEVEPDYSSLYDPFDDEIKQGLKTDQIAEHMCQRSIWPDGSLHACVRLDEWHLLAYRYR